MRDYYMYAFFAVAIVFVLMATAMSMEINQLRHERDTLIYILQNELAKTLTTQPAKEVADTKQGVKGG